MTIKLWNNKNVLSNKFLLLEKLQNNKLPEKYLVISKSGREDLRKLVDTGFVKRNKILNPKSKRLLYVYSATKTGQEEYSKLNDQWRKEVKPKFRN